MSLRRAMMFGLSASSHLLNGLVGYWKFDGNSNDSSGKGNHGTDISMTYSAAKINNGAVFNGSTSLVSVSNSADFNFGSGGTEHAFSFSFWSYLSSTGTQFIMCKRNGSSFDEWQIVLLGNKIGFYLFGNNAGASVYIGREITANPTQNVWEHYVITYDASKTTGGFTWYKNGSLAASTAVSAGTYTGASTGFLVVQFGNALGLPLNGRLDETGIWKDITLTSADAAELYNSNVGKSYPF